MFDTRVCIRYFLRFDYCSLVVIVIVIVIFHKLYTGTYKCNQWGTFDYLQLS